MSEESDLEDLRERWLCAVMKPTRDALIDNGEITMSGLRRLDEAIGLREEDTYRLVRAETSE